MSCFHPLLGLAEYGSNKYTISGLPQNLSEIPFGKKHVLIPCGHCIGCRLDYSRTWADRMMLELETTSGKKALFVTLTYNNDYIISSGLVTRYDDLTDEPLYATLCKRDVQLFLKRVRKAFPDRRIRFYCAGEYGERTFRPHYHCILFGLDLSDFCDCKFYCRNPLGNSFYTSESFANFWRSGSSSIGFVLLSDVNWRTMAYVSRYVTKKLSGPMSVEYARRNVISEFALMSRRPGIGREYFDSHPDCLDYQNIMLDGMEGKTISIPKYYLDLRSKEDPDFVDSIKYNRKKYAEDSLLLQLLNTELSLPEYFAGKEMHFKERIKSLKRDKVDSTSHNLY